MWFIGEVYHLSVVSVYENHGNSLEAQGKRYNTLLLVYMGSLLCNIVVR